MISLPFMLIFIYLILQTIEPKVVKHLAGDALCPCPELTLSENALLVMDIFGHFELDISENLQCLCTVDFFGSVGAELKPSLREKWF